MAWPATPRTPFEAGVAAFERRRFDEARGAFDAALRAAVSDAERATVLNKIALTYLAQRDIDRAVAYFTAALAIDARCVAVLVNVGNLLLEAGVLDDALAHYEAALRIDDTYAPAHFNLGIAYKRLGRRADAVRSLRRATRLELRAGKRGGRR